jgi:hypothetical protein
MISTPWYPPQIEPVHNGVYQVRLNQSDLPWFRPFYDGVWYAGESTPAEAMRLMDTTPMHAGSPENGWRGIEKEQIYEH